MSNADELLNKLNDLKKSASDYATKLQDARTRDALITDKIGDLTVKLLEVADTVDWGVLPSLIEKAAASAQKAVEALNEALDEVGIQH